MPPLFGVLFLLFSRALNKNENIYIYLIVFCLVVFEVDKGYPLFSSTVYFLLIHKFVLPKIKQNFSCTSCINISYILLAYFGFYLFSLLLANIFLLSIPELHYYIIYYIVIEFFLVSVL